MKATRLLHDLGQSIWLDNITRDLLDSGTLKRYIDELSVTGLTSNPTIFNQAIKNSSSYDAAIRAGLAQGKSSEGIFFDLALEDITRAADLFWPIWDRTNHVDGWVSLEVSPLLAYDTASTLAAAKDLSGARTPQRLHQDSRHSGRASGDRGSNLRRHSDQRDALFSREHYVAAADAYLRAIERRIDAGPTRTLPQSPRSSSVAGTVRSKTRSPPRSGMRWGSRSRSGPTRRREGCSLHRAGSARTTSAPGRSACSGPARGTGSTGLGCSLREGPRRPADREHDA